MSSVKLDFNFCVNNLISDCMTEEDIEDSLNRAKTGYSKLLEMIENGEVGFTKLVEKDVSEILHFAKDISGKFNDLIIVGIGGSSLGIEAIEDALLPFNNNVCGLAERGYFPRIWIADNVDPVKINWILKKCTPEDTLVVVITKSGSTVETIANASIIYEWLKESGVDIQKHFIGITDPDMGSMRKFAEESGIKTFHIEKNVGGRFSVLSAVGLLPSAILGIDIKKMLEGAKRALSNEKQFLMLSSIYLHYFKNKNIFVLMPYSSGLKKFSLWFAQLWAESLGKRYDLNDNEVYCGTTPVSAIGAIDQHSQLQLYREGPDDKFFTFLEIKNHNFEKTIKSVFYKDFDYLNGIELSKLLNSELAATELALLKSKRASIKIKLDTLDEFSLGYLFMLFELTTAIVGLSLNINPFDQPGVEEGKQFAYGLLGRKGFESKLEEFNTIYKKINEYII